MNDKFDSQKSRKPAFQQATSSNRFSSKSDRGGDNKQDHKNERRFSDKRASENRTSDRYGSSDKRTSSKHGSDNHFSDNRFSDNRTSERRRSDSGFAERPRAESRGSGHNSGHGSDRPYSDRNKPSMNKERGERGRFEQRSPRPERDARGDRDNHDRSNRDRSNRDRSNRDRSNHDRDNRERGSQGRNQERREKRENATPSYVWGERELNATKAGKNSEGSVKVTIKGEVQGEKKTGALSPRAPEKIRKNRNEEMKVYGEAACMAVFQQRPESIVRLWSTVGTSHRLGKLMSYLATAKKTYHVVDNDELDLVSGSEHHGGVCMLIKKATPMTLNAYLQSQKRQDCVLVLAGINNSYNLGGIIRTAAYYGVKGIVCESADKFYSAAAARVAEGGMEHIYALESADADQAAQALKTAGYQVIAVTANKQAQPLNKITLGDKVAFVLSETVSAEQNQSVDQEVVLSFENPLNSGLNVAVNAGILLSAWYFR